MIEVDSLIVCEFSLNGRRSSIVSLYWSPSQSSDKYDHFIKTFELLLAHLTSFRPYLLLIIGDFNAESSSWWSGDVDNIEGTQLESITSFYGLHQIINESTHILPSSSSCIDLIFTNQPNMIRNSGVHPSLHQNCHDRIIFAKVNMKIFYPPPYKRQTWNYRNTNVEAINSAIESFNWKNAFDGKDIHAQVTFFNETLLNIFSNFIPNRIKTFKDSDPPWMTKDIKSKIKLKNTFYRQFYSHDGILVKMIEICADSIAYPLTLIFQNSLVPGIFANNCSNLWKKMINKLFQITDQFLFYRYVVKYLKS